MESDFYTMLYKPIYPDTGVVIFEPVKMVKGHFSEEDQIFLDEDGVKYFGVDTCIPILGKKDKYILDALDDEFDREYQDYELLYGFPIADDVLKQYSIDTYDSNGKIDELYERDIRSCLLYSVYDQEMDDNCFYLVDKYTKNIYSDFDVNIDIIASVNESTPLASDEEERYIFHIISSAQNDEDEDVERKSIRSNLVNNQVQPIDYDFNPDELEKIICSEVLNQDHVAKALVSMIYKNKRYHDHDGLKSNMLILGPSGCGKTELVRSMSRNAVIPVTFFDASSTSATGYVGNSVTQAIRDLVAVCSGNIERAENGIIVIDEIDKLAGESGVSKGDVQDELFKMLEGEEITVPSDNHEKAFRFNPKNVTFIGIGSAQALIDKKRNSQNKKIGFITDGNAQVKDDEEVIIEPEDLIKFGLKPELLRRFAVIKVVKPLDKEKLVNILKNSKISNLHLYEKAFSEVDHVKVVYDNKILNRIAEKAITEKAGASGLKRVVDDMMQTAIRKIRILNGSNGELVLSEKTVEDPDQFKLYKLTDSGKELVYRPKVKKLQKKIKE